MSMRIKKINKKMLFTKALEDGIKKAIEITLVGLIVGLSINTLLLAIAGVMGGSLYCKNSKINNLGGKTLTKFIWR